MTTLARCRPLPGFTLIEMLVVVAIVAMLAAAAHPMLVVSKRREQETELRTALRTLRSALDAYKQLGADGRIAVAADGSGYPETLSVLADGVPDLRDPNHKKIYLLRRLPRDPFADLALAPADTWGVRSYDSPPDDPHPGADVFDVYSLAPGLALDGTRYRDW
jgi:general secretion pathway protein G